MKRLVAIISILAFVLCLVACGKEYSQDKYDEIASYVKENKDKIAVNSELQHYYYEVETSGFTSVQYGYYYSKNNEIVSCDQGGMGLINSYTKKDDGYYFGTVEDESDWSYVRKIENCWYYFEVHDYLYN